MPEGDTVWLAAARLRTALVGDELVAGELRVPSLAQVVLAGRTVADVQPRGKHLLTRFVDGATLHTHFRMEGSWHLYRPGEPWRGGPDHQVRAVLRTTRAVAVGYRLGVVEWWPDPTAPDPLAHLGPDVLGPDWDLAEVLRRLAADPGREVGQALLDQTVLAGVGNIYRTEALFLQGVTPWTPVDAVPDLAAVVQRARTLLLANRDHAHQSTTGRIGRGQEHWVYGRSGLPCRRCGATVRGATQGPPGRERVTAWCPRCQTGPAPTGSTRRGGPPARGRGAAGGQAAGPKSGRTAR